MFRKFLAKVYVLSCIYRIYIMRKNEIIYKCIYDIYIVVSVAYFVFITVEIIVLYIQYIH